MIRGTRRHRQREIGRAGAKRSRPLGSTGGGGIHQVPCRGARARSGLTSEGAPRARSRAQKPPEMGGASHARRISPPSSRFGGRAVSLAATLGHRWALVAFDSENSAIKFHALAAPQRGTRTKRARPPNRLVAASVIGFDGPGRVGRPIDAKAARVGPLPAPLWRRAAGPRRRALGRRRPTPRRRSGRRRRPRAVRAAGPHPRRGTEGLRRPAQALGRLVAASSVSLRSRDDVRGGPAGRRRVELRHPAPRNHRIHTRPRRDGRAARRGTGARLRGRREAQTRKFRRFRAAVRRDSREAMRMRHPRDAHKSAASAGTGHAPGAAHRGAHGAHVHLSTQHN